ncbi:signal peptidase II [Candidatus Bipolaricaulota bacterium]|nr:signal peptidase II [Candidatus Bipolaricaulota bacterium]
MHVPGPWPLVTAALVLAADQATKAWAMDHLVLGQSRPLLGSFLRLTRAHNLGGAFGLFPEHKSAFIAVSLGVSAALLGVLVSGRWGGRAVRFGGALVLAGAVGNVIDRLRWGYVLDFLELPHWPVFNVADTAIVLGAAVLAVGILWRRR